MYEKKNYQFKNTIGIIIPCTFKIITITLFFS